MIYIYDLEFYSVAESGKHLLYMLADGVYFCVRSLIQTQQPTKTILLQGYCIQTSESRVNKLQIFANNCLLSIRCVVTKQYLKMEYLKFVGPPALGAMSLAKYIISRSSEDESFMTGIGKK